MWCDKARLSALQASPETVEQYCAAVLMSKDDPSPGQVLNVISAIAKFHVIRGLNYHVITRLCVSSSKP